MIQLSENLMKGKKSIANDSKTLLILSDTYCEFKIYGLC